MEDHRRKPLMIPADFVLGGERKFALSSVYWRTLRALGSDFSGTRLRLRKREYSDLTILAGSLRVCL